MTSPTRMAHVESGDVSCTTPVRPVYVRAGRVRSLEGAAGGRAQTLAGAPR